MDIEDDDFTFNNILLDQADEVLDYRFLTQSLPKTGEKDFEPDGSAFQSNKIEDSKELMYSMLSQELKAHERQVVEGIFLPWEGQTLIVTIRGNYFRDIGRNIPFKNKSAVLLNKIETLYLVERGTLIVYLGNDKFRSYLDGLINSFSFRDLDPLNLQYVYGLLTSFEIEKYQVFAYLKRLGYLVQDYRHFVVQILPDEHHWLSPWRISWFGSSNRDLLGVNIKSIHYQTYSQILKKLSIIPSYAPYESLKENFNDSEFQIHYNVWKPRPAFSKKLPPTPDFQICITKAFPQLHDIRHLFNQLNHTALNIDFEDLEMRTKDHKLKHGTGRTIVLAIINNGVSFVNLSETQFSLTHKNKITGYVH
ncbi:tRNA-splicing endonuclease subunit sen54 [Yamadazyma tenuis]|uniref:tRNA-splicing endonuclease subunit Sen54 N-terminal domain-containing protein n=1 Tax=Candida tenuis (strain ATCC 10573 / BCRC 21748 / CBS 615 / JCM 9827 / NBRC 10315 / NRRL Y-1498 / VKM Y-70) TaxID=590646 RepID=G3AWJ6_CANTC|nr:uncharacterized protein CANTEDRAFT_112274 [Yamadazyma tenuis ATCC 10573]EGV66556.1 hypothetical protein CANTEDRAFT_112274 [Yamadazyma tenuis ATCC 10573]WEJ95324.1 tRNA-splicing endonuclease subunit sen54 [Yamadazyma tenuis]